MLDRQALKATDMRCSGDVWDGCPWEMAGRPFSTRRGANSASIPKARLSIRVKSRARVQRTVSRWDLLVVLRLPLRSLVARSLLTGQRY